MEHQQKILESKSETKNSYTTDVWRMDSNELSNTEAQVALKKLK